MKIDMVGLNIVNSSLVAVCREMGIRLMKTAYSTIFNEGLDFTCALSTPEGDMLAVAEFCPAQIGAMPVIIEACANEIPVKEWEEGDVIIHNDPYRGGCHIPEHTVFKPVFYKGDLVGLAVAIGHIAEVGGNAPGAFCGDATEIFHEGFRVPPVKIKRRGKEVPDVWKLMLANVRTPRVNYGDLRALISAIDLGEKRFLELLQKYGRNYTLRTCQDILEYSERRMRAEIRTMPDGVYTFEDYLDDDGVVDESIRLQATLIIDGDRIIVDYTGSSKQARGCINATFGVTTSATYNAILHVTDPEIPKNSGCFRPIKIIAPPGSVVNVDYPAPEVGGNTETHPKIAMTVMGALAQAVPGKVMASEGATATNFVFGGMHPDYNEYYACYDLEGCGWGGRAFADGNNSLCVINGNCRLIPVEVFETRFPWIIHEFKLHENSGGAGKFRGGLGLVKVLQARADEITVSQVSDRHKIAPWGLFGGGMGGRGRTFVKRKGSEEWRTVKEEFGTKSTSKYANITLNSGDMIILVTPGGGGFGDPKERATDLVMNDVLEGFISLDDATLAYGLSKQQVESLKAELSG